MMKILYLISVLGHGRGGHGHSLNCISRKIGEQNEVKIISFGPRRCGVIESNPHFLKHIDFNGINFFHLKRELNEAIREFNPSVYHCFENGSYNIVRLLISSRKNKLIVTKCGGPNPVSYPRMHNLILFSLENLNWFRKQEKYKDTIIHLIPNRVTVQSLDKTFQPIAKDPNDFVFIRICRIGRFFKKSIQDSIDLADYLLSQNLRNVRLFIIGVVEDPNLLGDLKKHARVQSGEVSFFTDPAYTAEAAKMLYLADAVIGTGRGLMESASLAIPLLVINAEGNIPVLLNNENFLDAFATNFSERNVFPNYNHEENLKNIAEMVTNKNYRTEMSKFSKATFEKYFDLNKVTEAYPNAYAKSITGERNLLADSPLILKSILKFFHSYLKERKK
jgi:glycosyltransferase involved in cell wall biosynthesis